MKVVQGVLFVVRLASSIARHRIHISPLISLWRLKLISSSTWPCMSLTLMSMRSRNSSGKVVHADVAVPAMTAGTLGLGHEAEGSYLPHGDRHAGEHRLQRGASAAAERALECARCVQRHVEGRGRRRDTMSVETDTGVGHGSHGELNLPPMLR